MNTMLYALCVFALPLWLFWGLHIVLEFRAHFSGHPIEKEDDA